MSKSSTCPSAPKKNCRQSHTAGAVKSQDTKASIAATIAENARLREETRHATKKLQQYKSLYTDLLCRHHQLVGRLAEKEDSCSSMRLRESIQLRATEEKLANSEKLRFDLMMRVSVQECTIERLAHEGGEMYAKLPPCPGSDQPVL